MISHRNVVHHCGYLRRVCEYTPESISVTWLPYFHDYGLIEGLLEPLYNGTPGYAMSPFAFLKRPFNWLQAISRHRATHTQAPNFAYEQCVRRIKPEQLAQLDLGCLRSAGNGAEPINPRVLEAFYRTFAPCGFRWEAFCPAYGLAETTLMVSCCSPSLTPRVGRFRAERWGRIASSRRRATTMRCGRSRAAAGSSASSTWPSSIPRPRPDARPTRSARSGSPTRAWPRATGGATTRPRPRSAPSWPTRGKGRSCAPATWASSATASSIVTSRIKDLIIVAGANHYPQDIEWTVEKCHPDVRPSGVAAFSIPVDGEERLVVAAEVERGSIEGPDDTAKLLDAIRRAVAEEHEVPVHAVLLLVRGSLPKTASGKVQRHGCWRLLEEGSPDVLASWIAGHRAAGDPRPDIH